MSPPLAPALVDLAREHTRLGRTLTMRAEGHSMWPLIRDGALVTVEPPVRPVGVGDIVLVARPTRLVLHRVVAVTRHGVVTKGDAVARPDGPVPASAVLARLPLYHPHAHRLIAHVSRLGGRPLAGLLQRLRLAVSRLPL